jgi:xanthine dehydrogenase accessory factor
MEIYIEPQQPRPRLLIVGTLPVAQALAQLGKAMNYHVLAMELDGERLSNAESRKQKAAIGGHNVPVVSLPDAHEYIPSLAQLGNYVTPSTFVVVATHGNYDEAALEHLLRLNVAYIGLVSSRRRAESVRDYLQAQGFNDEELRVLKAPAGLDIHARRGDEIALSIMAEIVQKRRSHEGIEIEVREVGDAESGKQKAETATHPPTPPQEGETTAHIAIDPICQMEVEIATAKYHSEYEGTDYYFCCAGCKRTFDGNPTAYVTIHYAELQSPHSGTAIDPICRMEVEIATTHYHSQYEGVDYYFCCAGCKRTFDANPVAYVQMPSVRE